MSDAMENLLVNVNVEITPTALETIVKTAKEIVGMNEKGHYRVDTAEKVGELISQFMAEKNFDDYVKNIENYTK